ncbi:OLC1v1031867C1 [Oldenlandia corymbosa var. corymbosa]|uniref:OLC1v1031867C1 n=1 Tax=Oldenlandia corymbosa var. corymbosa TaxID=529605 RepID=A0AAV1CL97_OLDCO|nr:OLC1v1031867C1 [Oldenlandia corymbosa var. corymbosa]
MIGMQFNNSNVQAKGVPEVNSCFPSSISVSGAGAGGTKVKKDGNFEPISVLDPRSPSPSTSTSTLSSSCGGTNGGGGGGTNSGSTGNLVVGSSSSVARTAVPLQEPNLPATEANNGGEGGQQKEEWVSTLHGLQAGFELSKHGSLGLDWESIISESAAGVGVGGQDQWIYSDDVVAEESNSKPFLLQGSAVGGNSSSNVEIDVNGPNGVFGGSAGFEAMASAVVIGGGGGLSAGTGNVVPITNSGKLEAISPFNNFSHPQNQSFSLSLPAAANSNLLCLPNATPNIAHQQQLQFAMEQHKSQNLMPLMSSTPQFQNAQQNFNLLNSLLSRPNQEYSPQPKRQNLGNGGGGSFSGSQIPQIPLLDPDPASLLRKQQQELYLGLGQHQLKPFLVPKQEVPDGGNVIIGSPPPMVAARQLQLQQQQQQQQVVYDQLYKATELTLAGNFAHAQGILARLNHHLSPAVKPFQRAAFFFKEALQMFLLMPPNRASKIPTPLDGFFKMGAYKTFSDVSPLIQFMNFTSNQVLLGAIEDNAQHVHIVDFDFGCGAQWSSFMQELPRKIRGSGAGPPSLKITAFASPSSYDSVEISLIHESLSQFALGLGIKFELEVVNFDSFDPSTYPASSFRSSQSDTIVVNFPLWSISSRPSILPSLLCFIKQLSPKVMVVLNQGCERFELPPSPHLLNALQYYEVLLDSIDAAHMPSDGAKKIERFLIQPNIESIVFGRMQCPNQIPPASNLLASAGFSTMSLSNFVETQAECVVSHCQVRGFHVEKRKQGSSLVLCWQHRELLSASIWKC